MRPTRNRGAQINSKQWCERLFAELVTEVGSEGDPLYLYADDELLAKCTDGQMGPDQALIDFCSAFNSSYSESRFKRAQLDAIRWEKSDYPGAPPYIDALVMTVLAATLPPVKTSDVYGRQRRLLGLIDGSGIPPGYEESVPSLWGHWNRWLDGPGRIFGTPTAKPGGKRMQGYARSQSFIRARDKQDVYDFFDSVPSDLLRSFSPKELLDALTDWLAAHPSRNPRLQARAEDLGYEDEFLAYLPRSVSYWTGERALSLQKLTLDAMLLWDEDADHLELVTDLRRVGSIAGEEVRLLDSSMYNVAFQDSYLYLFNPDTHANTWFEDPILDWHLNERLRLSWSPKDIYVLNRDQLHGWIEIDVRPNSSNYRLLCTDVLAERLVEAGVGGRREITELSGWEWIESPHPTEIAGRMLDDLLQGASKPLRTHEIVLSGGLPLGHGQTYLEGGEPDAVVISGELPLSLRVDGNERLEAIEQTFTDGARRIELAQLVLDPGDHSIIVRTDSATANFSIRMQSPIRTRGHWYRAEELASFAPTQGGSQTIGLAEIRPRTISESLPFRPGTVLFAITVSGDVYSISPSPDLPFWVTGLGLGQHEDLETFIETSEIAVPDQAQSYYLAYRRSRTSCWRLDFISQPEQSIAPGGAHAIRVGPSSTELVDFLMADLDRLEMRVPERELGRVKQLVLQRAQHDRPTIPAGLPPRRSRPRTREDIKHAPYDVNNPYSEFLDWLSELPEGYATLHKSSQIFSWLWRRAFRDVPLPDFVHDVLRRLRDLGHVFVEKPTHRLWVAPSVISTLPYSNSLRVLAGGRGQEFLSILTSGDDSEASAVVDDFLQNIIFREFRQTDQVGLPVAPDNVFMQVSSATKTAIGAPTSDMYVELGLRPVTGFSDNLLIDIPTLRSRLDGCQSIDFALKSVFHVWTAISAEGVIGRWKLVDRPPTRGSHFLRMNFGYTSRYCWWDADNGVLSDIGWAYGRWAFASAEKRGQWVMHHGANRQLLLPRDMPLPDEVSKALVSRAGLLPRVSADRGIPWNLYENVPLHFAERLADVLGQSKGASMTFNTELSLG